MQGATVNLPLGLAARALRGLRWNYLGTVGRIVATFLSQIVLARLLGPEQFGLFGYAFLTVTFGALVVEMGLGQALVQTPQLTQEVIGTACGRLFLAGSTATLGVFLFADTIATHIFSAPQAGIVLKVMAPSLLVSAMTFPASAVLSRDIEFKVIQLAGLGSYVLGYLVVGIAAAFLDLGVWSLVAAWHTYSLVACLLMYMYSPQPLVPRNPFKKLSISRFGMVIMFTNLLNWVIDSGPHVAIGRYLGATFLGQYTVANNLVRVPADHLVKNLQTVLFPLAARARDHDAGLRSAYLTVLSGVGLIAFPSFVFVAVLSQPLVLMLIGSQWVVAAQVLTPLSLAMIGHAVEALCGPVLAGRGEPRVELRLKAVTLVLMIAVLAVTSSWSVAAVGWGVALVYFFRWIWMNGALMNRLDISARAMVDALLGPLLFAGLTAGAAWSVSVGLHTLMAEPSPFVVLMLAAALAILLMTLVVLSAPSLILGPHLLWLVDQLVRQRPSIAQVPGMRRIAALAADANRSERPA